MTPDEAEAKVIKHFYAGYNWAQSVLQVLQEAYAVSTGVDPRPAFALGGGIGHAGDVCGAVLGGAVAIGQLVGDHVAGVDAAKTRARQLALQYYRDFAAEFGEVDCPKLTGHDISTEEGFAVFKASDCKDKKCSRFVTYAVRRLLPVYAEVAQA